MTRDILQSSTHFRADLGALNETAAQEFSKWAAVNCIHHVMQQENCSTVLYATRQNSRTEQQHKNALRALASNRKIKLKTEASFLRLLHLEEYEVIGGEVSATDGQMNEAPLPTPCGMEMITIEQLPDGFDERAGKLLAQLVAASA